MTVSADGLVTLVGAGEDKVVFNYSSATINKTYKFRIDVALLPDGIYFLKNKGTSYYADISGQTMSNGTDVVQYEFTGDNSQRWSFEYFGDQYYCIVSANSLTNYYLGVENDSIINDAQIEIRTGTVTDGMKWKIEETSSGAYKITPKSAESLDRVMAVNVLGLNNNNDPIKQQTYNNTDYKDEWFFEVRLDTTLEGQRWSNWCWAASARMFSNHYYSVIQTQNQAVEYVKGDIVNNGGWENESQNAIGYYISNISGASLNMQNVISDGSSNCRRYSENVLRRFLDDGHTVFITRSWYDGEIRTGGHSMLITGYVTKSVNNAKQYRYIIYDPWPESPPNPWGSPSITNGRSYLRSYQWICNGQNALPDDGGTDTGIWEGYVTVITPYSSNSVQPVWN